MDYRDRVFMSVAENLSFSKAARDLHISQPAVTRHIKELEERYHTTLFARKGNKVYLTPAGEEVYHAFRKIAQHYRTLAFELGQWQDQLEGEFIIGASSTISQYIIPRAIASFHKRYPNLQIHLINDNSFAMEKLLLEHRVDLALVENHSSQAGIRYQKFLTDELIVVAGANSVYARHETLQKEDLLRIPLVLREKGSGTLEVIQAALVQHGIAFDQLHHPIHLGSTESIKNFLLDFDGLAIVSDRAVQAERALGSLVQLRVAGLGMPRVLRLAFRQGAKSRQVELFENFLSQYNF